ncbi:MAG TPA: nuclear transport factor 2 family protein [Acidimicrobiia bacterium]|nr:nuclear transport factor 2 family protein [Acidimicrobiia bacterium]
MSYTPQQVADRAEIHDVIVRYGWAIDTKDWALLDECFLPDAHLDYTSNPGGKAGEYPVVRAWLAKVMAAFPVTQHLMANIDVRLDGDSAKVRTMVTNPQGAATREGPLHFFYVGARYEDDFVRTPDGWKIKNRVETTMWFEGSLPKELLLDT